VTVLEASAGTGKTYTIAALAARYVTSGIPLHEILLVTFTRLATGELRERVRERLLQAEEGLTRVLDGQPAPDDEVVQLLATGPADEVRIRRDRLTHALADFDAATIATTHGFCLEALSGLGIVGDVEHGYDVTEDAFDLLEDGAWVAFTIKDTFLSGDDGSGFAGLVRELVSSGRLELQAGRRYRHRLAVDGTPLFYAAPVGVKQGSPG